MIKIVQLSGLTCNISELRSTFSADGLPVWGGKVTLKFNDEGAVTIVTANWQGVEESRDGMLVDFEGESDSSDPIYAACELYAADWSRAISDALGRPSTRDARASDRRRTLSLSK